MIGGRLRPAIELKQIESRSTVNDQNDRGWGDSWIFGLEVAFDVLKLGGHVQ